jgi:hypothetical protein
MSPYYTTTDVREDLAVLPVVIPEGYIADQIFPPVPSFEKAGSVAYATVNADVAAQVGRAAGVAPTKTQVANSATTFACAEAISRYSITPDEAKQMGSIANADEVGAREAKRAVHLKIESDVSAAVLGGAADYNFDPAKIHTQIQDAINAVEKYPGATCLITSTKTAKAMIQGLLSDSTQGKVLARIVSGISPTVAMTGLNFKAWVDAMAMYLGLDRVLLGGDVVWNVGANKAKFAVGKLDDSTDPLSHKFRAVLGKRFQFLRDGTNPFYLESIGDPITKNNHYDASVWYQIKVLNAGAVKLFDGVQDA